MPNIHTPAQLTLELIDCPLCSSARSRLHSQSTDQEFGVPGLFNLVQCLDCGHVYLNPRPDRASLPLCYPPGYSQHQPISPVQLVPPPQPAWQRPLHSIPGLRRLYRWLMDNKSQVLPLVSHPGRCALEVGCATGAFLFTLRNAGYDAQGVELVPEAAAAARSAGFAVFSGELLEAEFPSEQFDDIFAWMVLEHVPNAVATVAEVFRLLKPGGWFCFSVPNRACLEPWLLGKYWKGYDLPRHLHHFTPVTVRQLLSSAGFEEIRVIHQRQPLNWVGSIGAWLCDRNPDSRLGRRLLRWFYGQTPFWVMLALAPLAHLQAACRQSGRITVLARKGTANERP